jgi:myo-inositol-1(or 4)-monophosphatase
MVHPSHLCFVATQAALQAGDLLRKGFSTACRVASKEGKQNLVTEFDTASEACILRLIQQHFPTHAFLAEESGASAHTDAPVLWIIDPLDGTVNFAHHVPLFSVSIAACVDGAPVCGVVYQPLLGELFVAVRKEGAYLNGSPLRVSQRASLDDALLVTGFPYNVHENPLHCIDRLSQIIRLGVPVRRLGSAALDLCYVAAGRFDAYWEVSLHPWDLAAGTLIVEEAGGRVTHYDGSPYQLFSHSHILASNSHLHDAMLHHLNTPLP